MKVGVPYIYSVLQTAAEGPPAKYFIAGRREIQRSVAMDLAMDLQSAWQTHAKAMTQVRPWDICVQYAFPGSSCLHNDKLK